MTPVDAHANRMLRSEGVTDAVIDAIAACGASPRRESFLTLAKSFGFDGFSYIVLGALSAHPRIVEHWTSSGTAWSARYAERGYHLVDPRVTLTRNRTVPVAWDKSIGEREPRTCDFLYDAARHDLRGGIAWSAFDARVGRAVVTWDSKHAEVAPVGLRLGTIALLAGIVHEALVVHCNTVARSRGNPTLTEVSDLSALAEQTVGLAPLVPPPAPDDDDAAAAEGDGRYWRGAPVEGCTRIYR